MIQKKHAAFAIILIILLSMLFFYSDWLGRWIYPIHYKEDIWISSEQYNVDPYLVAAIIRVESNYNPDRVSSKNATGLMQIMPSTASWIISVAGFNEEVLDKLDQPEVNIQLGTWYIQSLDRQFRHVVDAYKGIQSEEERELMRIALIAASYNAGPGNLTKWLQQGTWDGRYETREQIPFGETRHYVLRVAYYYNIYRELYEDERKEVLNG